jgi:hypothetical protein
VTTCPHDWIVSDGHRAKYWCRLCPATGFRKVGQWAGKIYEHQKPHPQYRPSEAPGAQPHTAGNYNCVLSGVSAPGRVTPKPRSK